MAHFEVTVRLMDVVESDAQAAMRVVEDGLRSGGFSRWQVTHLGLQSAIVPARPARRPLQTEAGYSGGLLVAALLAWVLWFIWLLTG